MDSFNDKVRKYKLVFILAGILFVLLVVLGIAVSMKYIRKTDITGNNYTSEMMGSTERTDDTDSELTYVETTQEPEDGTMQSRTENATTQQIENVTTNVPQTEQVMTQKQTENSTTKPAQTEQPATTQPESTQPITTQPTTTQQPTTQQPTTQQPTQAATTAPVVKPEPTLDEQVENILNSMTLEEKICQMFILAPEDLYKDYEKIWQIKTVGDDMKSRLQKYPVAGFILFASNLDNPTQTKTLLSDLQQFSQEIEGLPFFTCVDEEGGRVARIGNNDNFVVKKVGPMNTITSAAAAYEAGYIIGDYLSGLGFNFDFAPDADVITNSKNTVIGDRSFGSDADIVSQYAVEYAKGLSQSNVLSTFKHFPGHGGTEGDTHEGFAYTNKTYDELMAEELKPFIAANNNGVDAIMVAHISVPSILGNNTPCSLSYKMVTECLRKDIGYQGLIITDSMSMGAITNNYSNKEAAVMAVLAGNDLILKPADFYEAYEGILEAVSNGTISETRIDESVRRIIKVKLQLE